MMRRRSAALLMTLAAFAAQAAHHEPALDDTERAIAAWVDANVGELEAMLEESVNINSGTMNHEGVRKVGEQLVPGFEALGFETRWIEMPPAVNRAGHLFAELDGDRGAKILAIGHLDTVFEPDDAFQAYVLEPARIAHGPGVEDMKSGNLIILYALRALDAAGALEGAQIRVALTGDEESPGEPLELVRRDLVEAGQWADIALGFESGVRDVNDDGSITEYATIARRSSSGFYVEVTGTQAHSSGVFSERVGAGAAFEAARILNAFYEQVRGPEYLTFNAGSVLAGTQLDYDEAETRGTVFGKTNVVPSRAVIHGGIRTISNEQLEAAREKMRAIVADNLPGTSATIRFDEGYPAMAPTDGNRRLQEMLSEINVALGGGPMPALDPSRRGAADISFVAPYTDGLAGLGAYGSGGHSPRERLELDSLAIATKRAAILIYRLVNAD
jgi:glutamate carboxypeptidase